MKYQLKITRSFKTDYKKLNKKETRDTDEVIKKLLDDSPLEEKNHDHELTGNYSGYRECHVHPDLLLVYKKDSDGNILVMTCYRISSHTNIFDVKKGQKRVGSQNRKCDALCRDKSTWM